MLLASTSTAIATAFLLCLQIGHVTGLIAGPFSTSPLDFGIDYTKDPFPPYPPLTNPDGSNISVTNLRGTRLYGWRGCSKDDSDAISGAFNDFYTLAQQSSIYKKIDWASGPSRDFWGASAGVNVVPAKRRKQILQIFAAAQQIYNNWWAWPNIPWIPGRTLWIEVRCSGGDGTGDPENVCGDKKPNDGKCPKKPDGSPGDTPADGTENLMEAWSNPSGTYSQITFCNRFFNNLAPLADVIAAGKKQPRAVQNNLETWNCRARCFFHEITHLTYFMNTPDQGPNVEDMQITYKKNSKRTTEGAYGPYNARLLRNYIEKGLGGFYTQRNSDSYAWFAVAQYVTSQIGFYPTNPSPGNKKPLDAPTDPWGEPIEIGPDDRILDAGTDISIVIEPDSDLLGTQELEPDTEFKIPGCPDNYPNPNAAQADVAPSSTITSAPPGSTLYCTDTSLEDGDGICTCNQGTVTKTITPAGGPGNACPTKI